MASPAAAIDLSGHYVVSTPVECTLTLVQAATSLQVTGFCSGLPLSLSGTVDPDTGAFTVTGAIPGLCADLVCSGTGDGEESNFTCTSSTAPCNVPLTATKCGNGMIDALETCDVTAGSPQDCCSARCRLRPSGAACTTDGNECTVDACDAMGTCTHEALSRAACRRCNGACRRDVVQCMATQCQNAGRADCRRMCKPPAAIRTLAYAQSECRVDSAGLVVTREALRIRRGDREPITVVEFAPSEPTPDPNDLCRRYGSALWGGSSVVLFPLQRLGVSPDGSGVVFEVNDEFSMLAPSRLGPEQKGFFYVRSDGQNLRRLGPPSRDRSFRLPPNFVSGTADFSANWIISPPILFSPNGRWIAFTDRGPGPQGDAVQIAALDLVTGNRRLVTQLPTEAGVPANKTIAFDGAAPYFPTCCPRFIDNETILFQTFVDPVVESRHLNPEHDFAAFTVKLDGSDLKAVPTPALRGLPGKLVPSFAVVGQGSNLLRLSMPGNPVNNAPGAFPISEVFLRSGERLLQLTKFERVDTFLAFLSPAQTRAYFLASADPQGTNPEGYCQIFSVDVLGGEQPRQLTHLSSRVCRPLDVPRGCFQPQGIGYGYYRVIFQDPVTKAVVFDSNCDPLGSNENGYQVFAMWPDGTGLRQLTDAAGMTTSPDGVRVELPGPFAYSAALH